MINQYVLFCIIIVLNILDGITTHYGLANGATEMNPLMDWAITKFGTPGMVGIKFIVLSLLGGLIYYDKTSETSLGIIALIFLVVVISNLYMIFFR